MKTIPRLLAVLLMLLAAVGALRMLLPGYGEFTYFDAMGRPFVSPEFDLVATSTALAFVLLGAWLTGKIFKVIHLPRITGYLTFGVLVGPHFISLITPAMPPLLPEAQMQHLRIFSSLAIVLIGLTAGGEIKVELLRRGIGKILMIVGMDIVAVMVAVFVVLYFGRSMLGFLGQLPHIQLLVVCLITAALAVSNSPTVLVALLSEMRSRGPMSETSLAVTVVKDLVIVVLFTVVSGIGYALLRSGASETSEVSLVRDLVWHLLGSIGSGALLGGLMSTVLHRLSRHMFLFVLAVSLGVVLISESMHFEPLLVALSAGFLLSNLWPDKSAELFHSVEELSLPVYCIFFAMAGAKIDLSALADLWTVALVVVVVRLIAVWGGMTFAARLAGMPAPARTWFWTALIPQAGISLALAASVEQLFAGFDWGTQLSSLLLGTIAIYECTGPILLRYGLIKAGEATG